MMMNFPESRMVTSMEQARQRRAMDMLVVMCMGGMGEGRTRKEERGL